MRNWNPYSANPNQHYQAQASRAYQQKKEFVVNCVKFAAAIIVIGAVGTYVGTKISPEFNEKVLNLADRATSAKDTMATTLSNTASTVGNMANNVSNGLTNAMNTASSVLSSVTKSVSNGVSTARDAKNPIAQATASAAKGTASVLKSSVGFFEKGLAASGKAAWWILKNGAKGGEHVFKFAGRAAASTIKGTANTAANIVIDTAKTTASVAGDVAYGTAKYFVEGATAPVVAAADAGQMTVNGVKTTANVISKVWNFFKR